MERGWGYSHPLIFLVEEFVLSKLNIPMCLFLPPSLLFLVACELFGALETGSLLGSQVDLYKRAGGGRI